MLTLPNKVIESFFHKLAFSDLSRLSCSSKQLYEYIENDARVQKLKYQRYILLFGILASCERHIPLDTLANRIQKSCQLSLSAENQIVLKFCNQGIPYLEKSTNKLDVPKLDTIGQHIYVIIENNEKVFDELLKQPWNTNYPLQDYRNRILRIKCINEEITNLLRTFAAIFPDEESGSATTSDTDNIYQSLCKKLNKEPHYGEVRYHIALMTQLSISYSFMMLKKFEMVLGVAKITVNGQEMSVTVKANPYSSESQLSIQLFDENQNRLGSMRISRRLYKDLESLERDKILDYKLEENILLFSKPSFDIIVIYIDWVKVQDLQDTQTGDRPLLRFLTQVMLEIFSREPARRLVVNSVFNDMDVYAFMGFGSRDDDFNLEREAIIEFRTRTGQLFPALEDRGNIEVSMDKLGYSEYHKTRYFRRLGKNKGLEPALIEYDPQEILTLEKQILRQPVLNNFSGPLFWEKW